MESATDWQQAESGNNRPISAIIDCYCLRDGKESTMIEQPSKYFLPGLTLGRPSWAACFYRGLRRRIMSFAATVAPRVINRQAMAMTQVKGLAPSATSSSVDSSGAE